MSKIVVREVLSVEERTDSNLLQQHLKRRSEFGGVFLPQEDCGGSGGAEDHE